MRLSWIEIEDWKIAILQAGTNCKQKIKGETLWRFIETIEAQQSEINELKKKA